MILFTAPLCALQIVITWILCLRLAELVACIMANTRKLTTEIMSKEKRNGWGAILPEL